VVSNTASTVYCEGRAVHLVGTSHVSQESAEEVRSTILRLRPDVVMLELCATRLQALRQMIQHGSSGDGLEGALVRCGHACRLLVLAVRVNALDSADRGRPAQSAARMDPHRRMQQQIHSRPANVTPERRGHWARS
jgi:TraB/PrgY/gumN family